MAVTTIWRKHAELTGLGSTRYGEPHATGMEVRFGVWPVAPGHHAGVVWTADRWTSTNWTDASWDTNVPNDFGGYDESWLAEISCYIDGDRRFWYALWVKDGDGVMHWDNNRGWNYETTF